MLDALDKAGVAKLSAFMMHHRKTHDWQSFADAVLELSSDDIDWTVFGRVDLPVITSSELLESVIRLYNSRRKHIDSKGPQLQQQVSLLLLTLSSFNHHCKGSGRFYRANLILLLASHLIAPLKRCL